MYYLYLFRLFICITLKQAFVNVVFVCNVLFIHILYRIKWTYTVDIMYTFDIFHLQNYRYCNRFWLSLIWKSFVLISFRSILVTHLPTHWWVHSVFSLHTLHLLLVQCLFQSEIRKYLHCYLHYIIDVTVLVEFYNIFSFSRFCSFIISDVTAKGVT